MAACKEDETNLVGSRESAATRRSALTAVVAHESLCYQKIVDMLSEHFHVKVSSSIVTNSLIFPVQKKAALYLMVKPDTPYVNYVETISEFAKTHQHGHVTLIAPRGVDMPLAGLYDKLCIQFGTLVRETRRFELIITRSLSEAVAATIRFVQMSSERPVDPDLDESDIVKASAIKASDLFQRNMKTHTQ